MPALDCSTQPSGGPKPPLAIFSMNRASACSPSHDTPVSHLRIDTSSLVYSHCPQRNTTSPFAQPLRIKALLAALQITADCSPDIPISVELSDSVGVPNIEWERVASWIHSALRIRRMNACYRSMRPRCARVFNLVPSGGPPLMSGTFQQHLAIETEALFAKHLIDRPRNRLGPGKFAELLHRRSARNGVTCSEIPLSPNVGVATQVVGRAATESPRILRISYDGARATESRRLWLCGKGITMDTGGLGLKGQAGMRAMKTDMAGAAIAAGAVFAAARLQLPINVTALLAIAENAIGPASYAPGDVLRYPNGQTVEVTDTDSEGRLVLADLCLLADQEGADHAITIGTLTDVVSWTIGRDRAGLQTDSADLARQLIAAGEKSGEPVWHLPIPPEHESMMDGGWVDLVNSAGPAYGAAQPALFLKRFVGNMEWGHLEITGPSFLSEWSGASATGFGISLLAEYMRSIAQGVGRNA